MKSRVSKRLFRWFSYNIGFALFPLALTIIVRSLDDKLSVQNLADSPEILFFGIMSGATALGDISEMRTVMSRNTALLIFQWVLLVGTVFCGALYGTLIFSLLESPNSAMYRINLFRLALAIVGLVFLVSTLVQIVLGKIKGEA
jgi:hypothetical protein